MCTRACVRACPQTLNVDLSTIIFKLTLVIRVKYLSPSEAVTLHNGCLIQFPMKLGLQHYSKAKQQRSASKLNLVSSEFIQHGNFIPKRYSSA